MTRETTIAALVIAVVALGVVGGMIGVLWIVRLAQLDA
jgi:hypothetical protein